jgi:uncharacterized protein (TIGR02145 family)
LIGTQCWTKENLKVTRYNDGTVIGDSTNSTWGTAAIGARTENKEIGAPPSTSVSGYVGTFGYLYNWYAVTDPRKLCPDGWRVPIDAEWTNMIQQLDNTALATSFGVQSSMAGTLLKSTVTNTTVGNGLGWNPNTPPKPGNNISGFSALPGGIRLPNFFASIRYGAIFWSASVLDSNASQVWYRILDSGSDDVKRQYTEKSVGMSVRCLKD